MPPCPLAPAPAALFVPWPWQAPLTWLLWVTLPADLIVLKVWDRRVRAKRSRTRLGMGMAAEASRGWPVPQHPLPRWLRATAGGSSLLAWSLLLLVTMPSTQRTEAWYHAQFSRFASGSQDCSLLDSNLFTITTAHQHATFVINGLALGLIILPGLLVVLVPRARSIVAWSRTWLVRSR